ncbi:MAG: transporter substrate-binding domain-containing protein [Candidatus Brocadiia bacterium]
MKNVFYKYVVRIVIITAVFALLYFFFAGRSERLHLDDKEAAFIKSLRTLRVGYVPSTPPFAMTIMGDRIGMDIAVFKEIAKALSIEVTFIQIRAVDARDALYDRKIVDVIVGPDTYPLSNSAAHTTTLFDVPLAVYAREENRDIKQLTDLYNKEISVVSGCPCESLLRSRSSRFATKTMDSVQDQVGRFLAGDSHAMAGSEQAILYELRVRCAERRAVKIGELGRIFDFALLRQTDRELLALLNKVITYLQDNGTFTIIETDYVGKGLSKYPSTARAFFFISVFVLLVTVALLFVPLGIERMRKEREKFPEVLKRNLEGNSKAPVTRMTVREILDALWKDCRLSGIVFVTPQGECFLAPDNLRVNDAEFESIMACARDPSFTVCPGSRSWRSALLPRGSRMAIKEKNLPPDVFEQWAAALYGATAELTCIAAKESASARALEGILDLALDSRDQLFLVMNPDLLIEDSYGSLEGWPAEEAKNHHLYEYLTKSSLAEIGRRLEDAQRTQIFDFSGRIQVRVKGKLLPCSYRLAHKVLSRGDRLTISLKDERVSGNLSTLASRAYTLDSIGAQTAAIVSAFERLFIAINGHASNVLAKNIGVEHSYSVERIRSYATRGSEIGRRLLDLVTAKSETAEILELNNFVNTHVEPLTHIFTDHTIKIIPPETQYYFDGSPSYLSLAIFCILLNAVEASPKGAAISIVCSRFESGEEIKTTSGPLPSGFYAQISVQDGGEGIHGSDLPRLFEPFFTSKKAPHRGLGLFTALIAVRSIKGEINVKSIAGEGTSVDLFIPARERPAAEEYEVAGKGRSVLIFHSDPDRAEILAALFTKAGLKPSEVATLHDCQRLLHSQSFDAVIMDGGRGGADSALLLEEILRARPSMPVVVLLGTADPAIVAKLTHDGAARVLVGVSDLTQIVRAVDEVFSIS